MRILEGVDIETFIHFLNEVDQNHWILVEWRPDIECKIAPSICAVTREYLVIFRNWIMENQDFMWADEDGSNPIVKTCADILQECTFYYDENMISLYQRLHEINQHLKVYKNNTGSLIQYDFQKFVEDNLINEDNSEENSQENDECMDEDQFDERFTDQNDNQELDEEEPDTNISMTNLPTCYLNSEDRFNAEVLEQIFQKPFILSRK